ncbi:MAG: hypothetical protein ACKO9B_02695, partial [Planctomycetota bacterium]
SIGILAVGLTSVVALVPAGRSQASRGIIYDRATTMATNALADAITAGFTRLDSLTPISEDLDGNGVLNALYEDVNGDNALQNYSRISEDLDGDGQATGIEDRDGNGPTNAGFGFVVCDPVGAPYTETFPVGPTGKTVNALHVGLKAEGLFAPAGAARWADPGTADVRMALLAQGRDDLRFNLSAAEPDGPPLNRIDSGGVRSFEGRTTCMFALARIGNPSDGDVSPPLVAGELAKLSVVVFHGRSTAAEDALVLASYNAGAGSLRVATDILPTGRTIKEILKPGVVIYDGKKVYRANQHERFSQVTMASVESAPPGATEHMVYVTFSGPAPTTGPVQILVDSVGLAEQTVVLEGAGAYGR